MSEDCVFCKIVSRQIPATIVYEDHDVLAFMDIRPVESGHTLVIPKEHFADIFETPPAQLAAVHKTVKTLAEAVKKITNAEGISIVQQNGKAAGQDIFHLHVHIIPRFEGRKAQHFSELQIAGRESLEQVAQKIRQQLKP